MLWGTFSSAGLTSVHSGLQAQQQVREPGLTGPRQAGVQAAALLPQVHFTGFGQRVTDLVILGDQLLSRCQGVSALEREGWGGLNMTRGSASVLRLSGSVWYLFRHGFLKLMVEQTLVDLPLSCLNLCRRKNGLI